MICSKGIKQTRYLMNSTAIYIQPCVCVLILLSVLMHMHPHGTVLCTLYLANRLAVRDKYKVVEHLLSLSYLQHSQAPIGRHRLAVVLADDFHLRWSCKNATRIRWRHGIAENECSWRSCALTQGCYGVGFEEQ